MVFNPNTKKWILWWNQVAPNGTYLGYIAGVSDSISGPFVNLTTVTGLTASNSTWHAGDFHLFVDDDGTGYAIYSADHYMFIDALSSDFLSGSGKPGVQQLGPYFVEAPVLFKRKGIYYALFDHCCCFCYQGSGVRVFSALHPLGPWTAQNGGADLACNPPPATSLALDYTAGYGSGPVNPLPTPGQGCLYNNSMDVGTVRSQQSDLAIVDTPTGPLYLWVGDRWQQSPDGEKGHDPQYLYPLVFDDAGVIQPIPFVDSFTMDVI